MDFRTCPACQASVLEDDAAECPFCGASMTTGKPAGKPQAESNRPASSAQQSAKPAAKSVVAGGKPTAKGAVAGRTAKATTGGDGDPFDVDTSAARKAIPVKPKPAKGYMIRIACPMCERAGFISEAEVGKEVKCCNPQCLVPVFTANPPREKAPEPEPASSGGGKLWVFGGIGLVAVAGTIAAVMILNRRPAEKEAPLTPSIPIARPADPTLPSDGGVVQPPPAAAVLTPPQILARALEGIQQSAQYASNPRERALSARMLAESYALQSDYAKARETAKELSGASQYAAIAPLVIEAWQQLAAGNEAAAKVALDDALQHKAALPQRGRESLDIAAGLSAALVASGRSAEAQAIARVENDPDAGEYATQWRAAVDGGEYQFDRVINWSCLQELPDPAWAGVAAILAGRGRTGDAEAWARGAPNAVTRDNCLGIAAAFAAHRLGTGGELAALLERLNAGLEPAGQTRVWSAAGQALLDRGDQPGAREAAAKAAAALGQIAAGEPLAVPELKALYELSDAPGRGLPDPMPSQAGALAAFDVCALQSRLGDRAAAWASVQTACRLLRPAAPSTKVTGALLSELEQSGAAVRKRLAAALMIDDTVIVSRFSKYQAQVRAWHERAQWRRDLEVRLLRRAVLAGDVEPAWHWLRDAEAATSPAESQGYFDTPLAGLIGVCAANLGLANIPMEITAAYASLRIDPLPATPTDQMRASLVAQPTTKDWKPLLVTLEQYYKKPAPDRALADAAVISLVLRTQAKDPAAALSLAGQLPDTLLREDALWLLGARRTALGQGEALLGEFNPRSYPQGAVVSLYRGCIDAVVRLK